MGRAWRFGARRSVAGLGFGVAEARVLRVLGLGVEDSGVCAHMHARFQTMPANAGLDS